MEALSQLEAAGMPTSQAIRRGLIDIAERLHKREAAVAEFAALAADDADRAEMLAVAEMMESLLDEIDCPGSRPCAVSAGERRPGERPVQDQSRSGCRS